MHVHKIVYIKTFKTAPTCFDPKIIFRELHCSSLNLVLWQHVVLCKWYAAKGAPDYVCRVVYSLRASQAACW